ncbi:MAG: hypothetical protein ACM3X7_12935 [Solirubrobacterales bacterium]
MDKIIEIKIYGNGNEQMGSCCSKTKGCSGDCGCNGGCSDSKTCIQAYNNLKSYFDASELKNNISLKFIEAEWEEMLENEELRELLKQGYSLPIIVIDGIVRYYGGISNTLVYKDVEELLEYYPKNK